MELSDFTNNLTFIATIPLQSELHFQWRLQRLLINTVLKTINAILSTISHKILLLLVTLMDKYTFIYVCYICVLI